MQLNYNSVSRPLHARLKAHTETLYNKGLIINSSFSLIFILFAGIRQKKNGRSLHVCCDYRQLNSKTIPDRHPLPKIQNTLQNLGSGQYFSILDQGKTYHKIHLSPESRHLAAFITP